MQLDGQMMLFEDAPAKLENSPVSSLAGEATLMHGDCLELMQQIPDDSVDMILCDPPYGTTDCAWDSIIPLDALWHEWLRVAKERAAIVVFSAQPFTTTLIENGRRWFRCCWYWKKNYPTGAIYSHVQPMRCVEDICVFYRKAPLYVPQGVRALEKPVFKSNAHSKVYATSSAKGRSPQTLTGYPTHLLCFDSEGQPSERVHPTQKPVALLRYLIKTYTESGWTVLDSCMGSGSTGVAAVQLGRRFIGIELDENYYSIAARRIAAELKEGRSE